MISITSSGDSNKTTAALERLRSNGDIFADLDRYGRMGVQALAKATPKDSGTTSESWGYRVIRSKNFPGIEWYNTNVEDGKPIAILIQYGHGTGTGGYVSGRNYINPAMQPLFDQISAEVWKRMTT
jgi:hypothetical protein